MMLPWMSAASSSGSLPGDKARLPCTLVDRWTRGPHATNRWRKDLRERVVTLRRFAGVVDRILIEVDVLDVLRRRSSWHAAVFFAELEFRRSARRRCRFRIQHHLHHVRELAAALERHALHLDAIET